MAFNDDLLNLEVRHHIGIQRLSTTVLRRLIPILDEADAEIVAILMARSRALEGSYTSERMRNLLASLRNVNREAHLGLGRSLAAELAEVALYESGFQQRLFANFNIDFLTPSETLLRNIVTRQPLQGHLLREIVADLGRATIKKINGAIRQGMVQGETTEAIIRRVRGTKAMSFRDGAMSATRATAERVVRTAVNHISNSAREETFEQNADLLKGFQWVATLDTRTCLQCASLDGKMFPIGQRKGPRAPLHINCRCTLVPVTKSWRDLGIDLDEVAATTRASMNGQVSSTETFGSWLKKQRASVQDEALGPTRGALFRRGKLTVDRFMDVRGNQLTIDELRAREADAFEMANV